MRRQPEEVLHAERLESVLSIRESEILESSLSMPVKDKRVESLCSLGVRPNDPLCSLGVRPMDNLGSLGVRPLRNLCALGLSPGPGLSSGVCP